jgi:hypothetical protein
VSAPPVSRRRAQARRACAAVLSGLAFFAALQLGTAVALERWSPGAIDPDYGDRLAQLERARAADPARTLTVVVLGSSRVWYGLAPEAAEGPLGRELGRPVSVVNFGFSGGGGLSELLTWRRLQADGVRPDLVLVETWPQALDQNRYQAEMGESRLPSDRLRWFDLPLFRRYHVARPHLARETALAELNPFYSRRLWMMHEVAPRLLPRQRTGLCPELERLTPPPFTDLTPEKQAASRDGVRRALADYLPTVHVGGPGYDATHELLRSCREAGVPAALLMMPESPVYRGWYAPATWEQFQAWLEQAGRESGAPVVNAREWIDEDDFADTVHLLPQGAEKFTERLGREYLLPLLRGGQGE